MKFMFSYRVMIMCFSFSFFTISTSILAEPFPDTGQTKCYNNTGEIPCPSPGEDFYGQDAQYHGPVRSYTKLGYNGVELPDTATQDDGWIMTRDNVTGFIWEIKTNKDGDKNYDDPHDADNTYTWYDSNPATNGGDAGTPGDETDTEDFINELNADQFGGHSDWRIPTIKELSSLVNSDIPYPWTTIDTTWFPHTLPFDYWSSTTSVTCAVCEWLVKFNFGLANYYYRSDSRCVRAVRSGRVDLGPDLVDNNDGTVTDIATGLIWQKATAPTQPWKQALAYAEGLTLAGYSDWRLPNRNELQSLVDYSRRGPSINPLLETNTLSSCYWSSTTHAYGIGPAWFVDFDLGAVYNHEKTVICCVRAVRSVIKGDINNDEEVNLTDLVLALRIVSGIDIPENLFPEADINKDRKIGLEEVFYILQTISGLRTH